MNTSETGADLPAPLSLTLEDLREVAGGTTTLAVSNVSAVSTIAHWWWYGQPVAPWVNVGQVGAGQVLGG